ncbi:MAG: hypothetical protein ISS16_03345 [Ignavibacteria bacterium]|nr:hypothetical protein [Ignavibacteria bacterium]
MKNLSVIVILSFVLLTFSSSLYSQESSADKQTIKVGIGISSAFSTISLYQYPSLNSDQPQLNTAVSIPMIFSSVYKLEPYVSYTSVKSETKNDNLNLSNYDYNFKGHYISVGMGIFYVKEIEKTKLHFGARGGYLSTYTESKMYSLSYNSYHEDKGSGFLITPIIGAEYFFSDYFSLGGEVHFEWSHLNIDEIDKYDNNDEESYTSTLNRLNTLGIIVVRFYFL